MRGICSLLAATICVVSAVEPLAAQQFGQRTGGQQRPQNRPNNNQKDEKPAFKLPDDERLVKLHETFVLSAEKLALEYEKNGHTDKARSCYEEILRLVPTYKPAEDKLAAIKTKESTAERKLVDVYANKTWQDAGVAIYAGKPVTIKASGAWTLKISYNLPPDGMEIPKELQSYPLGALVGKIADTPTDEEAKIFLIGSGTSFQAEQDGRLWLRIYDSDPEDNLGKVSVVLEGSFTKK